MDNGRGCHNCFYDSFDGRAYPCSMCIRGLKREDMWKPEATGKDDDLISKKEVLELLKYWKHLEAYDKIEAMGGKNG